MRSEAYSRGAALLLGLCAALALAEAGVRLLALGPVVAPRPVMVENDDKSYGLECYPPGRSDKQGWDLAGADVGPIAMITDIPVATLEELREATPDCVPFAYNSWTRRDREFEPDPGASVLVVGDSFTEGAGVVREATFPERLQQDLKVRVFNGGRRGLDQPELGATVGPLVAATQPTLVVYAMTLNDYEQEPAWAARQEFLNDFILDRQHMGTPDWKLPAGLRWSELARLVASRRRSAAATAATLEWYRGMNGAENAAGFERTLDDIHGMRTAVRAGGGDLVVALLPLLVSLEDYPFEQLHADTVGELTQAGVDAIDLLPAFVGRDASELWVHAVDRHPNTAGHAIIAEALRGPIQERLAATRPDPGTEPEAPPAPPPGPDPGP
ncbi:MAG: hypothetical protein GY898_00460 [Proteobacteria bacterium]|nr:hypothetical protein [Pseudomonadota bacterium]